MKERSLIFIVEPPVQTDKPLVVQPVEELGVATRPGFIEQPGGIEVSADHQWLVDSAFEKVEDDVLQPQVRIEL
jgi:hypothetical protein